MSTGSNNAGAITTHEDRLSDLPECVLSNILSRLPVNEALRTYFLSRDWKYKCTCIGDIDVGRVCKSLSWYLGLCHRVQSFERFMSRLLELCQDIRVSGFRVQTSKSLSPYTSDTQDSKFISLSIKRLIIVVSSDQDKITLSRCLYSQSIELKAPLSRNIVVGFENWFPSLKHLYLNGQAGASILIMNEKSLETGRLFFPVLKTFRLRYFEFLNAKFVEIIAPKLTEFSAYGLRESNGCVIKICAPELENFSSTSCHLNKFVLCTPLLSVVVIDSFGPSEITAMQVITLLQGAPTLEDLHPSSSVVEAFVKWKTVHLLSRFKQLRILKLWSISPTDLMELLQGTPYLNKLDLPDFQYDHEDLPERLPHCIVSQLKEVKYSSVMGSGMLYLTKQLLEKAEKLEKVIIYPKFGGMMYDEICSWLSTLGPESSLRICVTEPGSRHY